MEIRKGLEKPLRTILTRLRELQNNFWRPKREQKVAKGYWIAFVTVTDPA